VGADGDATEATIGVRNEGHVHASLKRLYAGPGDRMEAPVDGYQVDVLCPDRIIEVQTGSFSHVAAKLRDLVERHPVRLVHPIAVERYAVRAPAHGRTRPVRRRMPRRGEPVQVFEELVSFPELIAHEHFELEVVLTREEELRDLRAGRRGRRKRWVTVERRLLEIVERRLIETPTDLLGLLPGELPARFTNRELAGLLDLDVGLARQISYCLDRAGLIERGPNQGNAHLFVRSSSYEPPRG